nr:anaerobic ribonucleoside-triphosphate reductase activating protein [Marinicella sp. W31]MDC2879302.1 anaerobic ribonucleoside-triphosphate reductase activating protein [Marinicella sp. W31]
MARLQQITASNLSVGGLEPFSLCDWPDRIVATLFLQGCPWRCPYCHNPSLLDAAAKTDFSFDAILGFLESRRGLLDGVVFSGGEPTLQKALLPAMEAVRAMGFKVGLHSGGVYPERLRDALALADWIGLDIKAPTHAYDRMTGTPQSAAHAFESLDYVLESGIDYEVRTTVHERLLSEADIEMLRRQLAARGVTNWKRQTYRTTGVDTERMNRALKDRESTMTA